MKILITGADGFIGSALVEELASESSKYELFCITRGGSSVNLSSSEFTTTIEHDLLDENMPHLPSNIDIVIHLAGNSKTFLAPTKARRQFLDNVTITSNAIAIAEKLRARRFIFASSVYVYSGIKANSFNEGMSLFPSEALGISKLTSELMLKAHTVSSDLNVCALRLFTVFGPGSRDTQFLPETIRKLTSGNNDALFGNPSVKRDFIYISDVLRAFKLAIHSVELEGFNAVNIASGRSREIQEVVSIVKKLTDSKKEIKFIESFENNHLIDLDHCGDINLAKQYLNWNPEVEFEAGLRHLIDSII